MAAPFVTLSLNPAIDQTVVLEALRPGAVNLARDSLRHAGGKGINVAACLADWGVSVTATGLLGEANDAPFRALFAARGIAAVNYGPGDPNLAHTRDELVPLHQITDAVTMLRAYLSS